MSTLRDHLEKVHAFATVVRLGSFRKAAVRLRISQPALSQSVQVLEGALGRPLLVRTSRGVLPTEEGRMVERFADRLALDLEGLEQQLAQAAEPMAGALAIGCFESLAIGFLPGFLARAAEIFPKLHLSIASGSRDELPEMLLDRRVELAIGTAFKADRRIVSEPLFAEHYRLFVAAGFVADARTPLLCVPDARDDAGYTVADSIAAAAARRRPTIGLSTFEVVRAFTLHRLGIGVLPTFLARADASAGRLVATEVRDLPASGFGDHQIVVHRLAGRAGARDRQGARVLRLVEELKRYATPRPAESPSSGSHAVPSSRSRRRT